MGLFRHLDPGHSGVVSADLLYEALVSDLTEEELQCLLKDQQTPVRSATNLPSLLHKELGWTAWRTLVHNLHSLLQLQFAETGSPVYPEVTCGEVGSQIDLSCPGTF